HLIGPLQSNKTRLVAERFQWVQTVDREKIARRLSDQRPAELPPLNVLIQVNASGESSKAGIASSEVEALARTVASLPRLRLRGGRVAKGFDARAISVIEVAPVAREKMAKHGVRVSNAPDAASAKADTLVLAVKPQDVRAALASVASSVHGKLVISIAAGVRLAALSRWLGGHRSLVRCMPNAHALVDAGIAVPVPPPEGTPTARRPT